MKIIFWSQSGNTEGIAKLILKGIEEGGKKAELLEVSSATLEDIKNEDIVILGCPASESEELDESAMEPFVNSLEGNIQGKKVALFGSYGWGDGEWMRNWEERMEAYGANLISEGLIINERPESEEDKEKCINFGKLIAKEAN